MSSSCLGWPEYNSFFSNGLVEEVSHLSQMTNRPSRQASPYHHLMIHHIYSGEWNVLRKRKNNWLHCRLYLTLALSICQPGSRFCAISNISLNLSSANNERIHSKAPRSNLALTILLPSLPYWALLRGAEQILTWAIKDLEVSTKLWENNVHISGDNEFIWS